MFSGDLKEIVLKLIEERKEPKRYSLLKNQEIWNQEYYVIDTDHVHSLESYYPQKKLESVMEKSSLQEVMDVLKERNMDYNDVLFLDRLLFEDYAIIMAYFQKFTTLGSIVKNSASDKELESKSKEIIEEIKKRVEESETKASLTISLFDQFILMYKSKETDEIKKQIEEKELEVTL